MVNSSKKINASNFLIINWVRKLIIKYQKSVSTVLNILQDEYGNLLSSIGIINEWFMNSCT
jgi:hypothetical protein